LPFDWRTIDYEIFQNDMPPKSEMWQALIATY